MNTSKFRKITMNFAHARSMLETNTSIILFRIIGLPQTAFTVLAEYEVPNDNPTIQFAREMLYRNGEILWQEPATE